MTITEWPAQSPDSNLIENVTGEFKTKAQAWRPIQVEELKRSAKEEWAGIIQSVCETVSVRLVKNYNNKQLKGYKIDY